MKVLDEGDLRFHFPDEVAVEKLDRAGRPWPVGMKAVDFVVEMADRLALLEVKDPSGATVPPGEREQFLRKMETKELVNEDLVPKARDSWAYLHLMKRDHKPLVFVAVIGGDRLSLQPPLLMGLRDRIRARLDHEAAEPWKKRYVADCAVVLPADLASVLPGSRVERTR